MNFWVQVIGYLNRKLNLHASGVRAQDICREFNSTTMFASPDTRIDELISKSVYFQDGQEREFTGIHIST